MITKEQTENTPCSWQAVLTTCPVLETPTPHDEETPNSLTAPRCFTRFRDCWPGSMKSPISILHLPDTISLQNQSQTSIQVEHICSSGLTFSPPILHGQGCPHPQYLQPNPNPWRSWILGQSHSLKGPKNVHVVTKKPQKTLVIQEALVSV